MCEKYGITVEQLEELIEKYQNDPEIKEVSLDIINFDKPANSSALF